MITVGEKLAGFEVVSPLKSGGMATLYLGRRRGAGGFSRHVAIKVVHEHLANDENFVRMFLDEARLCARIDHPNVVHVEELGEVNGHYFLVMEYVHGCSLSQLISTLSALGRRLTPDIVGWIGMRVASGLHAAHELRSETGEALGVVHRDVSPQNILLAYKGYVKLIDFGIAKAAGRSHQTRAGSLKGKFAYMSPEQALGRVVDRRTDVYALGIVMWELLTMRKLFEATNDMLLLDAVRNPNIPKPSTLVPDIPPALENVIMAALARDPAQRPKTARDLQQDLAAAIPGALVLDAPHVADLLETVMGDEIEKETAQLPESFSTANRDPGDLSPRTGEEVLRSFTMSIPPETPQGEARAKEAKREGVGELSSPFASPPRDARYPHTILLDDHVPPQRPSDGSGMQRDASGAGSASSSGLRDTGAERSSQVSAHGDAVSGGRSWARIVGFTAATALVAAGSAWLAIRANENRDEPPSVAHEPLGIEEDATENSRVPTTPIPSTPVPREVSPQPMQTALSADAGARPVETDDERPATTKRSRAARKRAGAAEPYQSSDPYRTTGAARSRKAKQRTVDGVPIVEEVPF